MRSGWRRRRIAAGYMLTCAVAGTNACASSAALDPMSDADPVVSVRRGHPARRQDAAPATFWDAVSALDVPAAERLATTVSERFFAHGLELLTTGDDDGAEVAFGSLLGDTSTVLRARARVALTLALETQGHWAALASVPQAIPLGADSGMVDRAAVDAWAAALRDFPPSTLSLPERPVVVPLRRSAIGTPVVEVLLNGRNHLFWLDTGAGMTMISTRTAGDCGVAPIGTDTLAIAAAAGRVAARPALVAELRIGGLTVRNLPIAILADRALDLERPHEDGQLTHVRIEGVIGSDLLRQLDLTLDLGAGTATLARPAARGPKQRSLMWVGFPVVRLLTRDGRPVLFGLDTGADSTLVTDAWLDQTPDPQLGVPTARVAGLGRLEREALPVVRHVVVSDGHFALRMRDVPLVPERRQTFVRFHGVLGANVLAGAAIRMDVTNGIFEIRAPGLAPLTADTGFIRVGH